jgi:hypothetical protein
MEELVAELVGTFMRQRRAIAFGIAERFKGWHLHERISPIYA